MSIATATRTITRAHTATHLSNAMEGALVEILEHLGVSARSLMAAWAGTYDPAIRQWIEEGSLSQLVLECHRPDGEVEPIFEFPVEYSDDGAAALSHRHVAQARLWVKLNRVPSGTAYKVVCQHQRTPTSMPGWTDGYRASTVGLRSITFGTLAAGPYATASIRAYTS